MKYGIGGGAALFLGVLIFAITFGATGGFAPANQELVASSDVVVRAGAPTVDDDIDFNFLKGVIWVDTSGGAVYIAEDTTDGAAVWTDITAGGSTFNAEESDALVTSNASVLDFGAGFDVTDSPAGEANVVLDYTEDPIDLSGAEVTGTLDLSDHVNLSAGTGATLTGDSLSVDLGTAIDTSEITDGTILEADLAAVDTANDEECLTYEATGGDFEWQSCASGGSGTLTTVKQDNVQVGDADIVTIDFGDGLTCTESPDTEINCTVDLGEAIDTSEITDGTILEADLAAVDTANDEECLTYEATGGDFEWQVCSSGSGTLTTIKQDGVQVGDADIVTIDFGDGLTCTESPDTEINCTVDLGESISLTAEVTGTLPVANGGTGQTAATADGVLVANGSSFVLRVIPDCDAAGDALNYDVTTDAFTCASGYLTTVDISDDTNLAAGAHLTLTGDSLSVDDDFLLNTGDTGTGVYDFGGATSFEVPNGAGGTTVNATGELTVDSTSGTLNYYDGSAERSLNPLRRVSITVEDPTSAEDIGIMRTDFAITITRETCVVVGSSTPSVTITLRHGTDRSAAGNELNTSGNAITSTTSGNEDTTFNDATIVADSFLWLETTAQSGTVDEVTCTWEYRDDA
jgi:hypothetical protein